MGTQKQSLNYDYLVIASGSETNFYGNSTFQESAYKLDSARDAEIIIGLLKENRFDNFIVSGGGYTGIEVATNLSLFFKKRKLKNKIIILERAPDILGPLPVWMKDYVKSNLGRMGIEILLNTTIEKIERIKVFLSGGKVFERAIVIWAAGVKTAAFIQNLDREKNPQGRLKVDDYLRLDEHCFVAGDTAYFTAKNVFLRMAVQFAIMEGVCVAENIKRSIKGKPLRKYQPQDAGYIIPMANNLSCGIVLGIKIKGVLATWLHFMMCIYRSYGIKNKLGIIKDLIHPIM